VLLSYFTQLFLHFFSLYSCVLLIALPLFKRFKVALSRFSLLASLGGLLEHLWNIGSIIHWWTKLDVGVRIIFGQRVSYKNWSILIRNWRSPLLVNYTYTTEDLFVVNCLSFLQFDEVIDVHFLTWIQLLLLQLSRVAGFEYRGLVVQGNWAIILARAISVDILKVLLKQFNFKIPYTWCSLQQSTSMCWSHIKRLTGFSSDSLIRIQVFLKLWIQKHLV